MIYFVWFILRPKGIRALCFKKLSSYDIDFNHTSLLYAYFVTFNLQVNLSVSRLGCNLGFQTTSAFHDARLPGCPTQSTVCTPYFRPVCVNGELQQPQSTCSNHHSEGFEVEPRRWYDCNTEQHIAPSETSTSFSAQQIESPTNNMSHSSGHMASYPDLSPTPVSDTINATSVADNEIINIVNRSATTHRRARKLRSRSVTPTRGCDSTVSVASSKVINNVTLMSGNEIHSINRFSERRNDNNSKDMVKYSQIQNTDNTTQSLRRHSCTKSIPFLTKEHEYINCSHKRPPRYKQPPKVDIPDETEPPGVSPRPSKTRLVRPPIAPRSNHKSQDKAIEMLANQDNPYECVESVGPNQVKNYSETMIVRAGSISSLDSGMLEDSEMGTAAPQPMLTGIQLFEPGTVLQYILSLSECYVN